MGNYSFPMRARDLPSESQKYVTQVATGQLQTNKKVFNHSMVLIWCLELQVRVRQWHVHSIRKKLGSMCSLRGAQSDSVVGGKCDSQASRCEGRS